MSITVRTWVVYDSLNNPLFIEARCGMIHLKVPADTEVSLATQHREVALEIAELLGVEQTLVKCSRVGSYVEHVIGYPTASRELGREVSEAEQRITEFLEKL